MGHGRPGRLTGPTRASRTAVMTRQVIDRRAAARDRGDTGVRAVVEANLAWAVLSVAALALWLTPTVTGTVWILLQAAAVAAFAVLQHMALRMRQESSD